MTAGFRVMDKNDQVSHRKTLSDDLLRKIGPNVLLFQAIERLLKLLIANHRADGTTIDFVERREKRAEKIETQMMGKLITQCGDAILSDAGEPRKETEEITQPRMSFTFTSTGHSDFRMSQCANLELMGRERNDLIHHFLPGAL
jgi:hypothetical protein